MTVNESHAKVHILGMNRSMNAFARGHSRMIVSTIGQPFIRGTAYIFCSCSVISVLLSCKEISGRDQEQKASADDRGLIL
jgi:hypothetical protein